MKKFIILFILFFSLLTTAQVNQQWVARYNGPANNWDVLYGSAIDNAGNVYVTGSSFGIQLDYATVKFNSSGVQQWAARYNGTGNNQDVAYSIGIDANGNVYVTGSSVSVGGGAQYCTIKYNSQGIQQWIQKYDFDSIAAYGRAIVVDNSGNAYVTGESWKNGSDFDFATLKYNSQGVLQWARRYNGPGNGPDGATLISLDDSGNIYVIGTSRGSGTDDDYATIKYSNDGTQLWVARYNGTANSFDVPAAMAIDGFGNVYVTGTSWGAGNSDYATIKYNSSGIQQWVQRYNGPGNNLDEATCIVADAAGNVYVTGYSYSGSQSSSSDYATIKYNSSGVQQWVQRYNGPGNTNDAAHSITLDSYENVYVTGFSGATHTTIKYNPSGIQQWTQVFNEAGESRIIAVNVLGDIYVSGTSGAGINEDYLIIKYSQPTGIEPISSKILNSFSLFQNYPNPFNPSTKIRFEISGSSVAQTFLSVYDILGKEVAALVNEQLKPGSYEVEWSATGGASNYPSGIYYYKLNAGEFTETKKMVLIK